MPEKPKIVLGADHAGFALKEKLRQYLVSQGYAVDDQGAASTESVDYPDYAEKVARRVASHQADWGVLVCGTGLGMAISANKVPGIRAATCNDTLSAHFARAHNDANVLTLGAGLIGPALAKQIVDAWLSTEFGGGRHAKRVEKIMAIESHAYAR